MLEDMYRRILSLILVLLLGATYAVAQGPGGKAPIDPPGLQRLQADTGAKVSLNRATGAARFVRLPAGQPGDLAPSTARSATAQQKSMAFFRQYGSVFGIAQPDSELREAGKEQERTGATHITYQQYYNGIPVFGAILKTHFDASNQLRTVNGTAVPNIAISTAPTRSAASAVDTAVAAVTEQKKPTTTLSAQRPQLMVFQAGLVQGVDLGTHLVWAVQVGNGKDVREFVYVDAQNGKIVDQITGTPDGLYRRAYDGQYLPDVPPSYPNSPFWKEGDTFPTSVTEANNMIISSKETYDFFSKAFGRDSFDGAGAGMDSIFNRGYSCPNASWNGTFISFCNGFTTDDVTAHEWTHAYTEYTDGLIYQWQPGALNEAYSDIFGETIDQLNSVIGHDSPDTARTDGSCSSFGTPQAHLQVNSPYTATYSAQSAQFGPQLTSAGVTGDVVLANDGYSNPDTGNTTSDACEAITNNVAGKVALVDRGTCNFTVKVKNAQNAGAIAVIVANNVASGLPGMGGSDATITIPSLGITQEGGAAIKTSLASTTVNATLNASPGTDDSLRWLMGEDVGFLTPPTGAMRDMWNPGCFSNPGKVTDYAYYYCAASASAANDNGGVHYNSGVPNHAYALLVDGGNYNGQAITGIGLMKAAHIYWRAMSKYQVPSTDFADHADALEAACGDLIGVDLTNLKTGASSGQSITASDCAQVSKAIAAVELRTPPTQCGFKPLLKKSPPTLACAGGLTPVKIFGDDFETNPQGSWRVANKAVRPQDFILPDWTWTNALPDGKGGSAFFVRNTGIGTCYPGGDESGVRTLFSPVFTWPVANTNANPDEFAKLYLTFQHWMASEYGWDGGNVSVRFNNGQWQFIHYNAFLYNWYNIYLASPADGNTNPLAGQEAFSGSDGGSVSGSWGWSYINLTRYMPPEGVHTIQFRWDFGNDGCGGSVAGWYVDDVNVYACRP